MPFLGIIYIMDSIKSTLTRCALIGTACLMALPTFGCGKKQEAEEAAVIFELPAEEED